jgi:hypothetical protein
MGNLQMFLEKAKELYGDKYDYSQVHFINENYKVSILCPLHGEFWITPYKHITEKCGCPFCKQAALEKCIEDILINNQIEYIHQKHFKWLGRQMLDFYLPKYHLGIECYNISNNSERFKQMETLKNCLCEENNVNLIYVIDDFSKKMNNDALYNKENVIKIKKLSFFLEKIMKKNFF